MTLTVVDALLVPVADGRPSSLRGWLTVGDDGRITGIGPGTPPAPSGGVSGEVLDAGGAIVAPGFVSAHSHLFTSGFRGIAPDATLYPWVRAMMEVLAHTGAEDVYWATVHGACDFLANGVTSAYNFLQARVVWLYDGVRNVAAAVNPPEYAVRQCAAAADAGLRVVDAFRLDEDAPVGGRTATDDETLGVFAELAAASADVVPADQHLGVSVMGAVQWAASPRTARLEVAAMDAHGVHRRWTPTASATRPTSSRRPSPSPSSSQVRLVPRRRRLAAGVRVRPLRAPDRRDGRHGRGVRVRDVVAGDVQRAAGIGDRGGRPADAHPRRRGSARRGRPGRQPRGRQARR